MISGDDKYAIQQIIEELKKAPEEAEVKAVELSGIQAKRDLYKLRMLEAKNRSIILQLERLINPDWIGR